jgi:hypothetical protein
MIYESNNRLYQNLCFGGVIVVMPLALIIPLGKTLLITVGQLYVVPEDRIT